MATTTAANSFLQRLIGAVSLDAAIYEEVEADRTATGQALAVDRDVFARRITETLAAHPRITVRAERIDRIPDERPVVLATGPLTAGGLAADLQRVIGEEYLYFYDALSPIVYADSIDMDVAFRASRYEDGPGDYLNLPLDRAGYEAFVAALIAAEKTLPWRRVATYATAAILVALGALLLAAPDAIPALTTPGQDAMMQMAS